MSTPRRFRHALLPASVYLACHAMAWAEEVPAPAAAAASQVEATAVAKPAAAPATAAKGTTLETVRVRSTRQPYRALTATGATKTATPIKDLPQSVKVITADVLQDAGVTNLAGALDLSSGISRQSNLGGLWDSYAMRGFTGDPNFGSDYMVNGFNSSRGYNGMRDGANTASVEVLKGPSSALYGRGEPGGTVNISTKKPLFQPQYTVGFSYDSQNTARTNADLTGPLNEQMAYRLNMAYEQGDSFRDNVSHDRYLVAPSFLWMISPDTTLSYEIEAQRQRAPFDRGVLAVNGELGKVDRATFLGEPADGKNTVESLGHQVFLQHQIDEDWQLQTGVSYRESSLEGYSTEASSLRSDGQTLWRQRRFRDYSATDMSGRFEVLGKLRGLGLVHSVLGGVDAYDFSDERRQKRGRPSATTPYAIDIYNPVYGALAPTMSTTTNYDEHQQSKAAYVQDQIEFSKQWKGLAALRYDSYEQKITNYLSGGLVTKQDLSSTSPRLGLVYQPTTQLSLYASTAGGFRPNSGVSKTGDAFPAEKSKSYELGTKFDSADNKVSTTVSIYQIKKQNVLTTDPSDINYSIAVGEVQSQGLELDLSGEVARDWRVSTAYAWTDAKVTQSSTAAAATGLAEGRRMANVPRHSGSIFVTRLMPLANGDSATVGMGLNHVGSRLGAVDENTAFKLPAYNTLKFVSSYVLNKKTRFEFSIDNLMDKTYYTASYSQLWVTPGSERTFKAGVQHTF